MSSYEVLLNLKMCIPLILGSICGVISRIGSSAACGSFSDECDLKSDPFTLIKNLAFWVDYVSFDHLHPSPNFRLALCYTIISHRSLVAKKIPFFVLSNSQSRPAPCILYTFPFHCVWNHSWFVFFETRVTGRSSDLQQEASLSSLLTDSSCDKTFHEL